MRRSASLLCCLALSITVTAVVAACDDEGASRRPRTTLPAVTGADGKDANRFERPDEFEKEGLPDPFAALSHGETQITALCTRAGEMKDTNPNFNAVTNAFCKEKERPTSLAELQAMIGLAFKNTDRRGTNGSNGNPGFALTGHSSSLVARGVSAVNPRAFVFSAPAGKPTRIPGFVVMGFARGEPIVEIAAETGKGGKTSFYLVKFDLACEPNCAFSDVLTPAVEGGWKGVTLYDDEDLKNTLVDCRHCHQPDGPSSKMMLRMQELEDPWTHWFRSDRAGGITLLQDFIRAHGEEEDYGGIPAAMISKSDGRALEDLVKGQGFVTQPNGFVSKTIEGEIARSSKVQPEINNPPGTSPTWQGLYDRAARGEFIPVPYHDVKVTDPDKLQYVTDGYKKFMAGEGNRMPDIRRVFLESAFEEMTFRPKTGASGASVLVQTCAQCHNPSLDQTISRAKFDVTKLDSMSASEKKEAIHRLNLAASNPLHMPPALMRALTDDARAAAIAELSKP